jgi:hypothetical protein
VRAEDTTLQLRAQDADQDANIGSQSLGRVSGSQSLKIAESQDRRVLRSQKSENRRVLGNRRVSRSPSLGVDYGPAHTAAVARGDVR